MIFEETDHTQHGTTRYRGTEAVPCKLQNTMFLDRDSKRSRYERLYNAVKVYISLYRHLIRVLFFAVIIVFLFCLVLIATYTGRHLCGFGNMLTKVESSDVMNDEIMKDVLRLYEMTFTLKNEQDRNEFRERLLKIRKTMEYKRMNKDVNNDNLYTGVKRIPESGLGFLPQYTVDPVRQLSKVLASLGEKIIYILTHEPKNGLERAANFVEEKFKERNIVGDKRKVVEEEKEAFEPFDDILYLQLSRYYERGVKDVLTSVSGLKWWYRVKETAPSVYTRRFYYPLRRYHRLNRFSRETPNITASWFDAIVDDIYSDATVTHFSLSKVSAEYTRSIPKAVGKSDAALLPLDSAAHTGSLFVNIASYRDKECWPGVEQMIQRSSNMFRVYLGIAQQNFVSDLSCVACEALEPHSCVIAPTRRGTKGVGAKYDGAVCFPTDNIRIRHIRARVAVGPTYGRYMAMLLYGGEDYALVLDAHTRFVYAWDARIVSMYNALQHPRAVISNYPHSYEGDNNSLFEQEPTNFAYLCCAKVLEYEGFVRLFGILSGNLEKFNRNVRFLKPYEVRGLYLRPDVYRPLPQPWAAGGFLFANASIIREVPFDPHLPYIFNGEEIMYSVRLWTYGYDIYSSKQGLFFHVYSRLKEPKVWNAVWQWYTKQKFSLRRIQYFLQSRIKGIDVLRIPKHTRETVVMVDADRFGTGRLRRVEDWYKFAGVDPVLYSFDGRWCGKRG